MRALLVLLLFLGIGMMVLHQSVLQTTASQKIVEYRYLPLPLDQWLKEQEFSAFNVMNDMVETTAGYCSTPTVTPTVTPTT